jgi:hypothetical protein
MAWTNPTNAISGHKPLKPLKKDPKTYIWTQKNERDSTPLCRKASDYADGGATLQTFPLSFRSPRIRLHRDWGFHSSFLEF